MRGDLHPSAFRLLNSLPVKTHTRTEQPTMDNGKHGQRPIFMRGQRFASVSQARTTLRCSSVTIYEELRSGAAQYLDMVEA